MILDNSGCEPFTDTSKDAGIPFFSYVIKIGELFEPNTLLVPSVYFNSKTPYLSVHCNIVFSIVSEVFDIRAENSTSIKPPVVEWFSVKDAPTTGNSMPGDMIVSLASRAPIIESSDTAEIS